MKKKILMLTALICITVNLFGQTTWTLQFQSNFIYTQGGSYSASLCSGVTGDDVVHRMVPTDPYSYLVCNPIYKTATFMNCPTGLAFNPSTISCDYPANVTQYYPDFNW